MLHPIAQCASLVISDESALQVVALEAKGIHGDVNLLNASESTFNIQIISLIPKGINGDVDLVSVTESSFAICTTPGTPIQHFDFPSSLHLVPCSPLHSVRGANGFPGSLHKG